MKIARGGRHLNIKARQHNKSHPGPGPSTKAWERRGRSPVPINRDWERQGEDLAPSNKAAARRTTRIAARGALDSAGRLVIECGLSPSVVLKLEN